MVPSCPRRFSVQKRCISLNPKTCQHFLAGAFDFDFHRYDWQSVDLAENGRENVTFRPALQSWSKLFSFCDMNNCRVVHRSIPGEN